LVLGLVTSAESMIRWQAANTPNGGGCCLHTPLTMLHAHVTRVT